MSKPLAAFYGQKSIRQTQQLKPPEYIVLGINQPLIPPESEGKPAALPKRSSQRLPGRSHEVGVA